ncbi:ATP-binding protein [Alcaligenes nematophilus]|uniref:ATP-binding protein n=1 Tax=Alcaligenes nematophilus TaxID=2994643 RepID=UPI002465E041|nr:ATP-binding protein [Alcaligenes nematophilus]MDH4868944.1 ATP-binding protein [Bacillus cereus]MDY7130262.1 ATP-binding protein [Alcaligenes nematophilus]
MPSSRARRVASATPTKRFFVDMLTRDIELGDAILDLLDNCLDGVIRKLGPQKKNTSLKPYENFKAEITINETYFQIKDNCGGIPLELAENYAFRFGRADKSRDTDLATVGVYGIGMKRALFKIGMDSKIVSNHEKNKFKVEIQPEWLSQDKNWELPIEFEEKNKNEEEGVTIKITKLHKNIKTSFDKTAGNFEEKLKSLIKTHYAYILKKGFTVKVNGEEIIPDNTKVLIDKSSAKQKIEPYIYKTEDDGVSVELILGMYDRFATDDENEEMLHGIRSKSTAGWTIICNDRIVLSNDTSHVTGWGEAGVPAYHSQFIAISGIVKFTSDDASKLPITTTKRGIDQSSQLYASVKDVMRDALKHFTSFTNRWKSQTNERFEIQKETQLVEITEAVENVKKWSKVQKGLGGYKYIPTLPKPKQETNTHRISFNRSIEEINKLNRFLFEDIQMTPSEVGEAAFEYVLSEAK